MKKRLGRIDENVVGFICQSALTTPFRVNAELVASRKLVQTKNSMERKSPFLTMFQ